MSTSNQLELEEVSADEELLKELSKFLPQSFQMTVLIQAGLKYKHFAAMDIRIYTLRHASYKYKLVVATNVHTMKAMSSLAIFWDIQCVSDDIVIEMLKTLPELNCTKPVFVRFLDENLYRKIGYILNKVSNGYLDIKLSDPLYVLKWEHSECINDRLSPRYSISHHSLCEEQARKIFDGWAFNMLEDFSIYKNVLKLLPIVTVYKTDREYFEMKERSWQLTSVEGAHAHENESNTICKERSNDIDDTPEYFHFDENNLIGWTFFKAAGDIGMTQIHEEHQRKGLGSAVTKTILGQLVKDGISPYVTIERENKISVEMHKKLGFNSVCVEYVCIMSNSETKIVDSEEMTFLFSHFASE